jgi:hypothetical protein
VIFWVNVRFHVRKGAPNVTADADYASDETKGHFAR